MIDFEEHFSEADQGKMVTVAFAGGNQNQFQFRKVLAGLGVPHILMRDSSQRYHAFGVEGIGDRETVIEYLRVLKYCGFRIRTIGVSSGAYSALLYGQLALVDEMIVMSPLSGREVDDFDPKWHAVIGPSPPGVPDLRQFFRHGPIPRTISFISDGVGTTECDMQMSTRIGITDIRVIPGFAHGDLARGMRDRGMFKDLLTA